MPRLLTITYTAACPGCGLDAEWTAVSEDRVGAPVDHSIKCEGC